MEGGEQQATGNGAGGPLEDPDNFGFLYGLARAPCFRETAMYSLGGGAALGALQFSRNRR